MNRKPGLFGRLRRALFGAGQGYELEDEDLDAFGTIVEVTESIHPDHSGGRIRLRGSTWKATSVSEPIEAGARARVVYRDNLVWVVDRHDGPGEIGEKL
jgi:membrane-bound ClpP family serine protease